MKRNKLLLSFIEDLIDSGYRVYVIDRDEHNKSTYAYVEGDGGSLIYIQQSAFFGFVDIGISWKPGSNGGGSGEIIYSQCEEPIPSLITEAQRAAYYYKDVYQTIEDLNNNSWSNSLKYVPYEREVKA